MKRYAHNNSLFKHRVQCNGLIELSIHVHDYIRTKLTDASCWTVCTTLLYIASVRLVFVMNIHRPIKI